MPGTAIDQGEMGETEWGNRYGLTLRLEYWTMCLNILFSMGNNYYREKVRVLKGIE